MTARLFLRAVVIAYVCLLIALPLALIVQHAFAGGLAAFWLALTQPQALSAFFLTLKIVAIVVPLNTVFGLLCAFVLVRNRGWSIDLLGAFVNLPLALSPVVVGLALYLVFGRAGWLGGWLLAHGQQVIFAQPGMVLATCVVSLPFVAREVVPVLREAGTDQEEAARLLGASPMQTFWRVTLPSIWSGLAYGVVVTTARALGEFGAVSIVSGRLEGQTQTLTLYVQDRFDQFDLVGAYTASLLLGALAVAVLGLLGLLSRRKAFDVH